MENLTPGMVWTYVAAILAGVVLVGNAADKIGIVIRSLKAPNAKQNEEIRELQAWRVEVDRKLADNHTRLNSIDEGNRVTQRALLALLGHGIDGNNIQQMVAAKQELEDHLINR